MGTRLKIAVPEDFVLARDACSYGYFLLAPNHWDPDSHTFVRRFDLNGGPAEARIDQPDPSRKIPAPPTSQAGLRRLAGLPLRVQLDRTLARQEQQAVRAQIGRMFRLDEPTELMRDFHRVDPRWKRLGRGRLFRSPTLFEDVIKTVTSCNVQWPSTIIMNTRLCEVIGKGGAFPSARKLARTRATTLRARCRVGYRDARLIALAKLFVSGAIDEAWLGDPATDDDAVFTFLVTLPGIGPYAASNIMQLLGRYGRLPLDTESVRHGRAVLGMTGTDARIMRRVGDHFAPFGNHAFRSYWFEMWEFYEAGRGRSWTWDRKKTGSSFTAAKL